ncbi:hypothetical protein SAMN05660485_02937 [Blastococcus fimeti]|nr:hypothetical protein SAMN05660485_02937 [Blastococcus fimeti]
MRIRGRGIERLALLTGAPVAVVAVTAAGAPTVRWVNSSMAELLGLGQAGNARVPLADVVLEGSRGRAIAAARDLVAARGQSASVQVLPAGGSEGPVWFHFLAVPASAAGRLLAALRLPVARHVVLHARAAPAAAPEPESDPISARRRLSDRLGAALLRSRRRPSRIVLAVVRVSLTTDEGPRPAPELEVRSLADRLRAAARDTDTVAPLGPGSLAVLAEDSAEGGEVVLAARLLTVVDRALDGDEAPPVVTVAVMEVADPDADPDAVLAHLGQTVGPVAGQGGVVVLPAWVAGGPDGIGEPGGPADADVNSEHTRRALSSGRFVLGARTLRRDGTASAQLPLLLEVSTVDDDRLTPVRVSAAGLATALDEWALEQLVSLDETDAPVALRLQPGGLLTSALGDAVAALLDRRPGLRLVLSVPEGRLVEALAAQRSVLGRLSDAGVGLGVSDWSGQLDPAALVRAGVALVELSAAAQRDAARPDGAARVAGLIAGLHAGLGPAAVVVADDLGATARPTDPDPRTTVWAAPSPARLVSPDGGGSRHPGGGRARRRVRRSP